MASDYSHQLWKPMIHQLTSTLMCPIPCLQEAVAQSKEAADILMNPAERTFFKWEKRAGMIQLIQVLLFLKKKKKQTTLHGEKESF